ncbi:HvfC/BufC N-terminal domain-containing protein [Pseudoduganella violaceinigra]|uniref:HvfC/BufC N-terminal domain-containing protein n=1 Tax=Pseudoduganella violaceinigra TaxID=246602 RepID=UPI00041A9597|nr:DNA-binding domain-containing protein [Pseudoduganella violaceinigra]
MNLANLQGSFQAMLAASGPLPMAAAHVPAGPGRAVYQNNYRAQLVGCLEESYPYLRAFIGEPAFLHAAAAHIGRRPPHAWTLDAYADGFHDTLQALFPDNPDLHELAWIEHALGQAFVGLDAAPVAPEALAAIDWDRARLQLTPTAHLRAATTNAADLWFALRDGGSPESEMLPAAGGLLVWRRGFVSCLRALDPVEYAALAHLQREGSFVGLCALMVERLGEEQGIASAGAMLADWLASELITGVENE